MSEERSLPWVVAAPEGADVEAFLRDQTAGEVLSDERAKVLDRLSRQILGNPSLRADPASVALAFWLRRSNMLRLREEFLVRLGAAKETVAVPCGRVFHIAPANVDTLFVYSWALAFFCGNRSVVRLSTRTSPVVAALIGCIGEVMRDEPLLRDANLFVQYERSDEINAKFSAWCAHRVVWGGNDTVAALRRVALDPHASERSFSSKYSWSAVSVAAWESADDAQRAKLADSFYNDAFWFDQMACSSPHVLFWVGAGDAARAAESFDRALAAALEARGHQDDASTAVRRRNHVFSQATVGGTRFELAQRSFTSIWVEQWSKVDREACGGGFLTHTHAATLDELLPFVRGEDQTMTHFGFGLDELRRFAAGAGARGLDRIVPIGEALSFSPDWDGFSLLQDFVRLVVVRAR